MKTFAFLPLLTIASALKLYIEGGVPEISGKTLDQAVGYPGSKYLYPADTAEEFTYSADNQEIFGHPGEIMSIDDTGVVVLGRINLEYSKAIIKGDYLELNSVNRFYACKNIQDDSFEYPSDRWVIATDGTIGDCTRVLLKDEPIDSSSPSASESSIESSVVESSSSAPPYSNTTVTDHTTVTDYTTYCPVETTITITTCDQDACNPTTITVDEPTTVTVTGPCLVPSTPVVDHTSVTPSFPPHTDSPIVDHTTSSGFSWIPPSTPTTTYVYPPETNSSSAQSSVAAPSVPPEQTNGANRHMVGLTGLAIGGALLL